ncbi:MAG: DEAD/DEAH box helicase [Bacteroidetes bacterium]|nr:DEAD/DEAH box helicase [Bacteroidota bacterium]
MGFETPTPIQEMAIPIILDGHDLIGCAQTGTGKTAAFLLPVLNKMVWDPIAATDTLIIVPTRELALQIYQALQGFCYHTNITSQVVYGGTDGISFEQEKKALLHGANVVIGTPGRLIAHLNMGNLKLESLRHLILDEADRMLDMGFVEDILKIIGKAPKKRQTLMFSATMPRSRRIPVLVATDVLSRGIDIEDIGMVINFDVPGDAEDYIHRIGRTARAESKGEAYTFVNGEDRRKFKRIEELMGMEVEKIKNPDGIAEATSQPRGNEPKNRFGHKKAGGDRRFFKKKKP